MYRIIIRNLSTVERHLNYISPKNKKWTYNTKYKKPIFSYGKWYETSKKPLTRIERQVKIKEFLDQY